MTDTASPVTPAAPMDDEDARLVKFGYTQRLDRSVGPLASFAIGFATISATTAVFTGFGGGYFTAGAPFVWTMLLAGAVFVVWAAIAADQTAQILIAIGVMAVCALINLYGVRFATLVNNIGVSLELVVTVGATIMVGIVAFAAPDHHQPLSVLFTGGTSEGTYV